MPQVPDKAIRVAADDGEPVSANSLSTVVPNPIAEPPPTTLREGLQSHRHYIVQKLWQPGDLHEATQVPLK